MTLPNPTESPLSPTSQPPAFLGKFFKTTTRGQKLMDTADRICELDRSNTKRVLVYTACSTADDKFRETKYSQKDLYDEAMKDTLLRISRKKIDGTHLIIKQRDIYNEKEGKAFESYPTMDVVLVEIELGYEQAKFHEYVYILTKKHSA